MSQINETVGTLVFDNLIVDNNPPADVFAVKIRKEASAEATLKKGTVLALSTGTAGDGKYVILGTTAETNETLTANCILTDDVVVGTSADVEALAYRTGHFNTKKLIVKTSYTLTAADKEALRNGGILLSDAKAY